MTTWTVIDKLRCAERELSYRRFVYPQRVEDGKMKPHEAERQIAIMAAIVEDYRALANQEQPSLL